MPQGQYLYIAGFEAKKNERYECACCSARLRWVHEVKHDDSSTTYMVGTDCARSLTHSPQPTEREKSLRAASRKRWRSHIESLRYCPQPAYEYNR